MNYLKLFRVQNLIMIAVMQYIIRYGFLKLQNVGLALNDWMFALLVLATVLIAAAGYVINDVYDVETDHINKPGKNQIGKIISEEMGFNIFIGLNIVALIIGFYLSNKVMKTSFLGIFIISSMLLYLYATSWKKIAVVGNLIIALLTAFSVLIIGMFDIIPAIYSENEILMKTLLSILFDYAMFAFLVNFLREIVKDIEDINGDYNQGMNTLPILIGTERTAKISAIVGLIIVCILFWYINKNLMDNGLYFATVYGLIALIAPLVFFSIKIWNAKSQKEFRLMSKILKLVIFLGILFVLVINYNIFYNAKG
ncbi:geranylgeranylglycerol-phosphate geranylgeranyltransferase [Flavobacterium sp.]|uniref:geranylgeranylglycerol-phosphate geranylgeranyltransferase n=1 Tax=Flavobacterium sp. TaxID=239 RepID=UPI0035B1ECB6